MYTVDHPIRDSGDDHVPAAPRVTGPRALVLCDETPSPDERNLIALLEFFGISWTAVSPDKLGAESANLRKAGAREFSVLASAARLADALRGVGARDLTLPAWIANVRSVYVHSFQPTESCLWLLRFLTSAVDGDVRTLSGAEAAMKVTGELPEICGPLSGILAVAKPSDKDQVFEFRSRPEGVQKIITAQDGEAFVSVSRQGVRFFLNASSGTIDINSPATGYFDVREYFCSAVPITMYLKWAFAGACWAGRDTLGCLIVDDPPLKPRYGFLRFNEALTLMDRHNFTLALAFIPWNWRRTNPRTVRTFKARADRLSLCIHGCDHTAGEFAAQSIPLLKKRVKIASQRMEALHQRTSIPHDRVMVFPQGAFSPESGRILKLNGFLAIANTEVVPSDSARNDTKIRDLWNVAIMKYGTFAIFTRRYLTHGIENFAFDALLGKPCLMVAHHDVFKDQARELVGFIDKLNSLHWDLQWRPLGQILSRSFRVHQANGTRIIQMYSTRLTIDNPTNGPEEAVLMKEESDQDWVKAVMVNQNEVEYDYKANHLRFKLHLSPGEKAEVRILYHDTPELAASGDKLTYHIKTRIRRHLSELRDNRLSQHDFLYTVAVKVKQLLK